MSVKRITTALIGFPLVAIILTLGNKYIVDIGFSIIAMLSLQEFYNAFKEKAKPIRWVRIFICNGNFVYTYNTYRYRKTIFTTFNANNNSNIIFNTNYY